MSNTANCIRCDSGFLNLNQVDEPILALASVIGPQAILDWIAANPGHDVQVCDCCGDGEHWYGEPGEHDYAHSRKRGEPMGDSPYAYNGGVWECW